MKQIEKINFDKNQNIKIIDNVTNIRLENTNIFNRVNTASFLQKKLKDKSTEWEYMTEFLNTNDELIYLYKAWDIELYQYEEADKESVINLILPSLTYNVLYKEAINNDIKMYSTGLELNEVGFYEVKNTSLHLKVSIYMKKYFESEELITPEVKLQILLRNSLKISR